MSDPVTERAIPLPRPVQPLDYSTPAPGRPGIITAIGVISIVVASLSLISGLSTGSQVLVFSLLSRMGGPPVAATAPATVTETYRDGLPVEHRQIVIDALSDIQPLDERQRLHLDALLEKEGRRIFRVPVEALSADFVRANVSSSEARMDPGTGQPSTRYVVGEGRLEIDTYVARFVPTGSGTTVAASWQEPKAPQVSQAQIDAVVSRIEQLGGRPMTVEQKEAMAALLSEPQLTDGSADADLFERDSILEPADQIVQAWSSNGEIWFSTRDGWATIEPDGQVQSSVTFAAWGGPPFQMSLAGTAVAGAGVLINLALAVYLLVIGIMTLRQHPLGGRLHGIYAVAKIPAALLGGLGVGWMWWAMFSGIGGAGSGASLWDPEMIIGVIYGSFLAGLGLIYPIALLIALRTRTVREYYAAVRG